MIWFAVALILIALIGFAFQFRLQRQPSLRKGENQPGLETISGPEIDIVIPQYRPYQDEPLERLAHLAYDHQYDLAILQDLEYELAHRQGEDARQLRQLIKARIQELSQPGSPKPPEPEPPEDDTPSNDPTVAPPPEPIVQIDEPERVLHPAPNGTTINDAPQKRIYINKKIDELEQVVREHWSNLKTLRTLHYELTFRTRKRSKDLQAAVEKRIQELAQPLSWSPHPPAHRYIKYSQGLLSYLGYKVGMQGLPPGQRYKLLSRIFQGPLPLINDAAYMREWGEPYSEQRLRKLAYSLYQFIKNARNRPDNMTKAINDWNNDLLYLRKTFYDGRFVFPWPRHQGR